MEVTSRLQAVVDDEPEVPKTVNGKLLMTQDEWLEKYKADSGRSGSSSGGHDGNERIFKSPRGGVNRRVLKNHHLKQIYQ
jgi:hypothetical protein